MPGGANFIPPMGSIASGTDSPMSVLHDIGRRVSAIAGIDVHGASGDSGSDGIQIALPITPMFRLFEVGGSDPADSESDVWSQDAVPDNRAGYEDPTSGAGWWWTQAKEVKYVGGSSVTGWQVDSDADYQVIWSPTSITAPSVAIGDWLWCICEPWSGLWSAFLPSERGVAFLNGSQETAPAYGVLRVGGYQSASTLACYKPDTAFSRFYVINSPSDVAAGSRGTCSLYAPTPIKALYDPTSTPAYGDSFGAKPGQWYLAKHYPGFIFVGSFDSVAHIGYFQPEPIMTLIGTVNTSLSPGSGGEVSLYMGGTGSDTDSTLDLTGADWFSATGTTFGAGAKVMLQWCNGLWLVSPRLAPRLYCGVLPSALTATTASVANCHLFPIDESGDITTPGSYGSGGLVATVYNVLNPSGSGGFIGASGTSFKACWNYYLSRYEFFDMPCAAS